MRPRNMLAIAILVLGSIAAFYCYTRLAQLLPMRDADAVTHAQAAITEVNTPMVKKGQGVSDVVSDVRFAFTAGGKAITGGYSVRGRTSAPEIGAPEPVVYLTKNPSVFLRGSEYDALPRQLAALRWMMWGFALAAMVLPLVVMNHRA